MTIQCHLNTSFGTSGEQLRCLQGGKRCWKRAARSLYLQKSWVPGIPLLTSDIESGEYSRSLPTEY